MAATVYDNDGADLSFVFHIGNARQAHASLRVPIAPAYRWVRAYTLPPPAIRAAALPPALVSASRRCG
jgi:hypothetical protein